MLKKKDHRCFGLWLLAMIGALFLAGCTAIASPQKQATPYIAETAPAPSEPAARAPIMTEESPDASPAAAASPASPTQPPYLAPVPVWGIETYYLGTDDPGLDLIKQSGANWVRRNALLWSAVEPSKGARNWEAVASLENELKAASAQGLQLILIVRSTPEWAQSLPGFYCSPPNPESLAAFGEFLHEAVRRYSVPPYSVQYWEIGNEPDVAAGLVPSDAPFGCWGQAGDPYYGGDAYAEILKAVYPQIKSANPQAQVLVGGLLLDCDPVNPPEDPAGSGQKKDCTPSRYLEGALAAGAGAYFDGISYHAYDYYAQKLGEYRNPNWNSAWNTSGPTLIVKTSYLRGLLDQYGLTGKYLMNTESALLCGRDGSEPECQTEDYQLTKVYFLAESYVSAIAEHLLANVWYSLTGWRGTGLVDAGMMPNRAYQAFKTSVSQLDGSGYLGALAADPAIKGYIFERGGKPQWVLWSLDGKDHQLQLDQLPLAVTDVFGEAIEPATSLIVGRAPVYISFGQK